MRLTFGATAQITHSSATPLGPGDYFGEMALIDDSYRYRSATITAETELHCLMFPKWVSATSP
jgi:CRP-like cAMP-binding protein